MKGKKKRFFFSVFLFFFFFILNSDWFEKKMKLDDIWFQSNLKFNSIAVSLKSLFVVFFRVWCTNFLFSFLPNYLNSKIWISIEIQFAFKIVTNSKNVVFIFPFCSQKMHFCSKFFLSFQKNLFLFFSNWFAFGLKEWFINHFLNWIFIFDNFHGNWKIELIFCLFFIFVEIIIIFQVTNFEN